MKPTTFKKAVILFSMFLIGSVFKTSAQSAEGSISAKVTDKQGQPIESAIIKLLKSTDSTLISSTASKKDGSFLLKSPEGSYKLTVSFIGFKSFKRAISISKEKATADLGTIILEEGVELNAVKIAAEEPAIKVKEDTTEYNAASYKTVQGAVVEDLLKKLPGVEVDTRGNISVQGEKIKITVEGKEFFGNDPKIATKNLPADAIKKVQLIEEKSERAKATGIDDGKREKVLNLVLKDDKKKGWFGNASVAGGTKDRLLGSTSANRFDKEKQLNFLLSANNVNQTGFSYEDASNFGGGSANSTTYSYSGGNFTQTVNGVNVGNSTQGLTESKSGGVNYSDAFGKKDWLKLSTSYFTHFNSTFRESTNTTQSQRTDETYISSGFNNTSSDGQSHRINMKINGKIDSLTTISLSPSFSFSLNDRSGTYQSSQINSRQDSISANMGNNQYKTSSPSFNGNFSVSRRFRKKTGSISLYVSTTINNNDYDNYNQLYNKAYLSQNVINTNRFENERRASTDFSIENAISRTLSKNKKTSLNISNTYNRTRDEEAQSAYEYNPATNLYELSIDSLRSNLESLTSRFTPEVGISTSYKKINFSAKSGFQFTNLQGQTLAKGIEQEVNKNYFNILPSLNFTYRPKPNKTLTLNTYSYAYAPNVSSLQLIQVNRSPRSIREGNPNLKASQSYSANLRYNFSRPKSGEFFNISLSYNKTFNSTSNNSVFDNKTATTYSKPVNISGNYRVSLNSTYSIPTKVKGLRLTPGISSAYSLNQNFFEGLLNSSKRSLLGGNINLSYAYKDFLNLTYNTRADYTFLENSIRKTANNTFFSIDNSGNLSISPAKKWRINSEVTHRNSAGRAFVLLNAGIQRYLLPNNRLFAEINGFDLLNNNSNVETYAFDTYRSDTRSNSINQYFYLKLTYKMSKLGGSSKQSAPPTTVIMRY